MLALPLRSVLTASALRVVLEQRRLIREGFEHGISGEKVAEAAAREYPACIRSATAGGGLRDTGIVLISASYVCCPPVSARTA